MPLWMDRLTAQELAALPRETTVFFFPVGAIEDHGPHLPMGLDLDEAVALCRLAAERLEAEKPGWRGVIFPAAPLAVQTATSQWAFFSRGYVLRDYLVDTGVTLIREGFRYLVAFTGTPHPKQLVAIEEAGRLIARRAASRRGRLGHWISRGLSGGLPALVSAQSGGTKPSVLWNELGIHHPTEHGGSRDTSVAQWLYQGTSREPKTLPPARAGITGKWRQLWHHRSGKLSGYWGEPGKATPFQGESALNLVLDDTFPKLRAWLEGANPNGLFRSWHSILPSNRTTFRAWMLLLAIAALFSAYVYFGFAGLME